MARQAKKGKKVKETRQEEMVQVDAFMIPAAFADMYRVLREAVAEDLSELLGAQYAKVDRVLDDTDEGEAVVAYDEAGSEQVRIYLNPTNVSAAQKARDKDQMDKFLESMQADK